MERFPHLNFIQKVSGRPRFPRSNGQHERADYNKQHRKEHRDNLIQRTKYIGQRWIESCKERTIEELAPLDENIVPVFLQLNPKLLSTDFDLKFLNIEIISEENDGFIIGASLDRLQTLNKKIEGFLKEEYGTTKIAELFEIIDGVGWKPEHILSDDLWGMWNIVVDDEMYDLEVSVAFDKPLGPEPDPRKRGGEKRLRDYQLQLIERDDQMMNRQSEFEDFIHHYGEITSSIVELDDSFACEVSISGLGLKDLVNNYPFVFDVSSKEDIQGHYAIDERGHDSELQIEEPDSDAPEIGVIDSGIMQEHRYIREAIKDENSKSYIDGEQITADYVQNGGHGTKVAGAILYPNGITNLQSPYKLPCFVRNLRILDENNSLNDGFPAQLMQQIVDDNSDCRIFNLSVNSSTPCRTKHMSSWASTLDHLMHNQNVLFIVSAGNIQKEIIRSFIQEGSDYPDYLKEPCCRIANPSQCCFAVTVGSINHTRYEDENWVSLGEEDTISPFSRVGEGIWGSIKPDLVEYGGGLNVSKTNLVTIAENNDTSPELIRSTLHGGSAIGRDSIGTSFATPKVAHIAAQLQKLYPDNINLLRALLVQGARLPNGHFRNPNIDSIRTYGYGVPSLERVTKNTEHRITFYNSGELSAYEADIYSLRIPEELLNPANEFDVLIEATLAYTANVRRTRQQTKSYLSTWLDWTSSKLEEGFDEFAKRSLLLEEEANDDDNGDVIPWKIRENKIWGDVVGLNRTNSTLQKDWAIIPSFQLPSDLSFAVRGHKGWDKNNPKTPYALTVSIELLNANIPIYDSIRILNEVRIEL